MMRKGLAEGILKPQKSENQPWEIASVLSIFIIAITFGSKAKDFKGLDGNSWLARFHFISNLEKLWKRERMHTYNHLSAARYTLFHEVKKEEKKKQLER